MKRIICTLALVIYSLYIAKAQNLVGVWQENTPEVAATYINSYSFFSDGTFHYNTNGFNGLNRILTIGGKYKTENNNLDFHVEYTIELVGGTLERSMTETLSDSWSIIDGKIEKIPLRNKLIEKVSFIGISNIDDKEYIIIDKIRYYKVSDCPNNE
ncbi:hypothetical protein [uncultured Bacteroides sp.]|uniref:hypothetical protein n=1 Tax=uncultured Bacteroides sp. TaxID=162156 RepID=UPI002AAA7ECE|nr:hypothetical protein [uncultured Bacteroides sp.]